MTDNKMILESLIEYEEANYERQGDDWQKQINRLIGDYRNKVKQEEEEA